MMDNDFTATNADSSRQAISEQARVTAEHPSDASRSSLSAEMLLARVTSLTRNAPLIALAAAFLFGMAFARSNGRRF
jgi:hypothetical protein